MSRLRIKLAMLYTLLQLISLWAVVGFVVCVVWEISFTECMPVKMGLSPVTRNVLFTFSQLWF